MKPRFRQEVLNVALAQLLQECGLVSAPESIVDYNLERSRAMPDVLVEYRGLRVMVEGEVDDQPDAEQKALASASRRVETGLAHIGIAVVYPAGLRTADSMEARREGLGRGDLRFAVVAECGPSGFRAGAAGGLETELRSTFDALVREDVVTETAQVIDHAVTHFAYQVAGKAGIIGRMSDALELSDLSDEAEAQGDGEDRAWPAR